MDVLKREGIYLWYYFSIQFHQIFKYYIFGIITGSCVSVFLKGRIHGAMAGLKESRYGTFGVVPASLLGALSPLCMYGTVPLVASFSRSGMRQDWIAAFMMSSVLINPQLFFYSFALGSEMALIRLVVTIICGIVAGLLVKVFYRDKEFYSFQTFDVLENHDTAPNIFVRLIKNIGRNIKVTLPYFIIGVALTALYQRYIPPKLIMSVFSGNKGFGALMAAALGVPLYTCGGGTIPLIAAWLEAGMSKGSVTAFMIAGPATKITNLGAVKIALRMRNFIMYILFSVMSAVAFGIIVDLIYRII